ncbi:hypothetical protein AWB95_21545 [Mycobacterium celatum]|uniref:Uncharacterized protein n=1 Tax=Mycobacterium celatum TaxID=28045 RepID=A0A1X1RIR2_MYCCE|nr:hypothetical protein AWB95_21545 [Mycobacterium celatum]PIB78212.1 hypothetical protein CQY23_15045 [Mycobacterium celatum]
MLLYDIAHLALSIVYGLGGRLIPLRNRVELVTHFLHLVKPLLQHLFRCSSSAARPNVVVENHMMLASPILDDLT